MGCARTKTSRRLLAIGALLGIGAGCATSSNRDVVLSDLMRQLENQDAAPGTPGMPDFSDIPDEPMGDVSGAEAAALLGMDSGDFPVGSPVEPLDFPAGGELTIQAGSVLRISVAEDPGLSGSQPVNNLGGIQLGYIGPVILDNLTEEEAAEKIRQILLSRDFHTASVTVKILRPSYDKVRIAGDVKRPGLIKLGAGDEVSLNNALSQAGGIRDSPWHTRVKIVRGGLTTFLSAYLPGEIYGLVDEDGNPHVPDVKLRNNDIAFVYSKVADARRGVRRRTQWVLVLGEVPQQGFVSFAPDDRFTMMNLIFRIGNLPPYANDKAIRVIREDEDGIEQEYRVNLREILKEGDPTLDFPLESGDRIIVPTRRFSLF